MATITKGFLSSTVNGIKINSSIPCNKDNYTNQTSRDVKYVVIHYTGNSDDTAKANCKYFQGENRNASAHFFVDEENIYQSVELRDRAWHCGTSGTYYHSACRNTNAIGIEMTTAGKYVVSEKTQINTAYLCAELCKMINVGADKVDTYVVRHYDVTHKSCPAQFVSDSAQWTRFKKWVKNILKTGTHEESKSAPVKIDTIKEVQSWANTNYKAGLTIDGSYGEKTKKALVKILQTELNQTYGSKLTVDGIWGSKTKAACPTLKNGSKNDVTDV